jgi:hypothetical protein
MKTVIVSAGDAPYFSLVKGLLQSIADQRPNQDDAIGILDVGLEAAQADELRSMGAHVVPGTWDLDFLGRGNSPRWFQAMTARSHLPKHFPGYDLILWIDADCWLQDWRAIDMLKAASRGGSMAIIPEIHHAYGHTYRLAELNHNSIHDIYKLSFPEKQAKFLAASPVFNSGVFALQPDSDIWQSWTKWMEIALQGKPSRMSEQCALNAAIYFDKKRFYPLPGWCNWHCGQARPLYDAANRRFLESVLPHQPISILHVTPRPNGPVELLTTAGTKITLPLDYLAFKASAPA